MKKNWTLPLRSIRSSQFRGLRQTSVFLQTLLVTRPLSHAVSAEPASNKETSEMAPKFELKTPKGTKDCKSLHSRGLFVYKILGALHLILKLGT
jgi:hypothetical protein